MLVLGRAIGPAGFAVASIALIGFQLVSTVAAQSFSQALVRYPEEDAARNATAFWLNVAFSIGLALVIWAVSVPLADLLALPGIAWLLPLTTCSAILLAPTAIAQARLSREMNFRYMAFAETFSSIVALTVGVCAVLMDAGLAALVFYAAVQRLVELACFMTIGRALPRAAPEAASARVLLSFSLPLIGMQILSIANGSIDQFFVGRAHDPTRLGLFGLGRRLTQQPTQMITFAIEQAMFPALTHARSGVDPRNPLFLKAIRLSMLSASFPMLLLAIVASDFVALALGADWAPAGPFIELFAMSSALLPVGGVLAAALRAEGRTRILMLLQCVRLILAVLVLSLLAFFDGDIWAMAVAVAIIPFGSLALTFGEASRTLGIPLRRIAREWVIGLLPAALMFVLIQAAEVAWLASLPAPTRMGTEIVLGLIVFVPASVPALLPFFPNKRVRI